MVLSGAFPGTIFVQVGAGIPSAAYTFGGAILGSITYGYVLNFVNSFISPSFGSKTPSKSIDGILSSKSVTFHAVHTRFTMGAVVVLAPLIYVLHKSFPWQYEVSQAIGILSSKVIENSSFYYAPTAISWGPILGNFKLIFQI